MSNTVVLFSPEIPQNTGNIARVCAVTQSALHLVGTLGFLLDDKHVKRAGLDYWQYVDVEHYPDTTEYVKSIPMERAYLFSSKATRVYTSAQFNLVDNAYICFGNETSGTAKEIMDMFSQNNHLLRIPMSQDRRCLNLAVSAGIALYEVLRQQGFTTLV